jgi:hypothetical protein
MNSFFICQEHSVFHSYRSRVFSFSATVFSFRFCLDFCSDLVLSLHQGIFGPLVYVGIHQKVVSKRFEWCWKREKVSYKKVVQKGACLDCGLDFCMPCLMSFYSMLSDF